MPLENLAPSRHLLHGQAEPSADLKSGRGPVELDRSRVSPWRWWSPGIKALLLTLPAGSVRALHSLRQLENLVIMGVLRQAAVMSHYVREKP